MLKEIFQNLNPDIKWVENNTIFLTTAGSRSYGLHNEFSDFDSRGITICPINYYLGFNKKFEQYTSNNPHDTVIFDIRKFFSLTKDGNPNTLELLFTEPEDHLLVSDLGEELLKHRDKFLSRNLKERYIGYAKAQAHRIKNHKRWIDNAPVPPPTREEFGLSQKLTIPKDQLLVIQSLMNAKMEEWNCDFEPFSEPQKIYLQGKISKILAEMNILSDNKWELAARSLGISENFILMMQREKAYQNLCDDYKNYLTWKKNRNPKRAELEKKIFYDAKHGSQLIRLLLLGRDILLTGKVKIKNTEHTQILLDIKNCKWEYERLTEFADKIEEEVEQAYFKSPLPIKVDVNVLDELCIDLTQKMHNKSA